MGLLVLPYLPVYKLTFYSLKVGPKITLDLYVGQKLRSKQSPGQIFRVTIAYLNENSKIKDFQKNSHPEIRKNLFFGFKMGDQLIHGIDLYMGKYSIYYYVCPVETTVPDLLGYS